MHSTLHSKHEHRYVPALAPEAIAATPVWVDAPCRRTEVMYRVQRAEADRLHALRRSAQAAAQRADRKGQAHKALEMWQHVEHLKVCACAGGVQVVGRKRGVRAARR